MLFSLEVLQYCYYSLPSTVLYIILTCLDNHRNILRWRNVLCTVGEHYFVQMANITLYSSLYVIKITYKITYNITVRKFKNLTRERGYKIRILKIALLVHKYTLFEIRYGIVTIFLLQSVLWSYRPTVDRILKPNNSPGSP